MHLNPIFCVSLAFVIPSSDSHVGFKEATKNASVHADSLDMALAVTAPPFAAFSKAMFSPLFKQAASTPLH